jgi:asparagine synthase (glutamine-hydrolysing)
MCGICGVVALGRPPETVTVDSMSARLAHRGPDGVGRYFAPGVALGHRRLAIIDLTEAGRQPFASDDGGLQLLHNGEIYNYRELRTELEAHGHRFRTATDTEVILRAYEEWGSDCVRRFNGMWAFALWDERGQRLFCSRDRFGVKPLYYRVGDGRFVFASELKAFRADPAARLEPNLRAVRDFLAQGYVDHVPGETFFRGTQTLPAAHSLVFDRNGLRLTRYWRLEPRDPPSHPAEAVRELFVDSVRLRLRSDVPLGTALSGGIDSSAIACAVDHLLRTEAENARPVGDRQQTFTVWFDDPGHDERSYAEAVAERIHAQPHWISFSDRDVADELPAIVAAQDEPFGSTSIVAQWHVMRAAKEAGLKVMLDGQGGDEVLAGYPVTFGYRFADLLVAARLRDLRDELAAFRRLHGRGAGATATALATPFLPQAVRWRLRSLRGRADRLVHPSLRGLPPTAEANGSPFPDRLRSVYHLILTERGLPELLRYEDRNSMAHSLEARVPFLDYRLVELLYSLDSRELVDHGVTKVVLRHALHDLLPPVVSERVDKLGFITPGARFLRGAVGALAADAFASRAFAERGWVDAAVARRRLERFRQGDASNEAPLWRALNLELWARTFLDA